MLCLLFLDAFDHFVLFLRPLQHPAEVEDRQDQAGLLEHCLYRCSLRRRYLWLQQPFIKQIVDQSLSDLYRSLLFGLLVGLVTMPAGMVGALMSVVGGDDKEDRFPIITGASLMAATLIAFACLSQHMSNLVISLVYIIYITGMGISIGAIMTNALASLKPGFSAQGNAFLNTIQQFAGAIGISLTSAIVALSQVQYGAKGPRPTAIDIQRAFFLAII